jgi:hypothetical protein
VTGDRGTRSGRDQQLEEHLARERAKPWVDPILAVESVRQRDVARYVEEVEVVGEDAKPEHVPERGNRERSNRRCRNPCASD